MKIKINLKIKKFKKSQIVIRNLKKVIEKKILCKRIKNYQILRVIKKEN